jgi:hypothetical protein
MVITTLFMNDNAFIYPMFDINVIKEFVFIKIIKGIEAIDWYNNYKYNARIS